MSDTEHWTTPSGYDLQRVYGAIGKGSDGEYITGYTYELVIDIPELDFYERIILSETEFESLKSISRPW